MQDILINWSPQETRVAVVEHGAVQELHLERTLERGHVGNIHMGKVVRVLPGMQSAFLDIGLERAAFLHVADLHRHEAGGPGPHHPPPPIEKQVFEGQVLMVQVLKDPIGSKGARLTSQISLAGRLLVFLPQDDRIGISQKIGSPEARDALRQRMQALAWPPGTPPAERRGGFILRTNAEDADDAALAEDIAYLRKLWATIREASFRAAPTARIYEELDLAHRVLRDLVTDTVQAVRIDSASQFATLRDFAAHFMPGTLDRLEHHRGERPIFDLANVDQEINRALDRRVDLKNGGYLIIDPTEAMTTIDVNTGGYVGARNFEETIFRTNLESTHAIARQLRLRNLGGIIVVDFIDMAREEHREAVLAELKRQLARDRVKVTVGGFTQLGLIELTRKRTRESLSQQLREPCPTCQGRGLVKTARTVCHEILREVLREARQFNPREFRVIASAAVIEALLDEEGRHLADLSDFIGKPIRLQAEPMASAEQYDIVLM